jgi:transposase
MAKVLYVGMDVDKEKIVIANLSGSTKLSYECVIANTPHAVKKYSAALIKEGDVTAAYEAGCFAFGLYHQLTDLGASVVVAAPGLIPRKPSDRLKTDMRDDLRRCKQLILHFLLRRGIRYEQGGPWTVKHKDWLATLQLPSDLDRQTLDSYLARLQELECSCSQVAAQVESVAQAERYREAVKTIRRGSNYRSAA